MQLVAQLSSLLSGWLSQSSISARLPAASPALLPLNEAAETDRAKRIGDQFGAMFPGVVQYTTDVLFRDLWLRPDLTPRDRSLVTISALTANGQVRSCRPYPNRDGSRISPSTSAGRTCSRRCRLQSRFLKTAPADLSPRKAPACSRKLVGSVERSANLAMFQCPRG
jgi:Carboxymuconolactone decarboxylase family